MLDDLTQNFDLVIHLVKERVLLSKNPSSHEKLVHTSLELLRRIYDKAEVSGLYMSSISMTEFVTIPNRF